MLQHDEVRIQGHLRRVASAQLECVCGIDAALGQVVKQL